MQGISSKDQKIYQAGKQAYFNQKPKSSCPYGDCDLKDKSFWLAGYHDADIETVGFAHFTGGSDDSAVPRLD
jgi:ribosome modulation factor